MVSAVAQFAVPQVWGGIDAAVISSCTWSIIGMWTIRASFPGSHGRNMMDGSCGVSCKPLVTTICLITLHLFAANSLPAMLLLLLVHCRCRRWLDVSLVASTS